MNDEKVRRLKKTIFKGGVAGLILLLAIVRCAFPAVDEQRLQVVDPGDSIYACAACDTIMPCDMIGGVAVAEAVNPTAQDVADVQPEQPSTKTKLAKLSGPMPVLGVAPQFSDAEGNRVKHKIYSVNSYAKAFPDLQDTQIRAAMEWGVQPVADRGQAELRKNELVFVGSNPYYCLDPTMSRSIPYLVPRAADLLQTIGRNFLDSLAVKHIPAHRIMVSSVLRTEDDVRRLRRGNVNASEQSCHRFGTTFDISYLRYKVVCPPGETRREVRNDSLLFVLSEVLNDIRSAGRCYVKYERKQSCFHITVR